MHTAHFLQAGLVKVIQLFQFFTNMMELELVILIKQMVNLKALKIIYG